MSDVNWESLWRNGQLTWEVNEEHRTMLDRFYAFYGATPDLAIFKERYPLYLEAIKVKPVKEEPVEQAVVTVTEVEEPVVTDEKKELEEIGAELTIEEVNAALKEHGIEVHARTGEAKRRALLAEVSTPL